MAGQVILYRTPTEKDAPSLMQRIVDFVSSDVLVREPSAITNVYSNVLTASPTFALVMLVASVVCIVFVARSMKHVNT